MLVVCKLWKSELWSCVQFSMRRAAFRQGILDADPLTVYPLLLWLLNQVCPSHQADTKKQGLLLANTIIMVETDIIVLTFTCVSFPIDSPASSSQKCQIPEQGRPTYQRIGSRVILIKSLNPWPLSPSSYPLFSFISDPSLKTLINLPCLLPCAFRGHSPILSPPLPPQLPLL